MQEIETYNSVVDRSTTTPKKRWPRPKRKPTRCLPQTEVRLLRLLWIWKLFSYQLARAAAFKNISYGNFYSKIRRLLREGYLMERGGSDLRVPVIQLTKKGYEYIQHDLGELREKRFAAQSVPHDYWATAFQIGEFISNHENVWFFTEQQIQCVEESLLPEWVPKSRNHIPDGLTRITNGEQSTIFAVEIDLNLKAKLRYDKAGYYFDSGLSKDDVVFWVCAKVLIAPTNF